MHPPDCGSLHRHGNRNPTHRIFNAVWMHTQSTRDSMDPIPPPFTYFHTPQSLNSPSAFHQPRREWLYVLDLLISMALPSCQTLHQNTYYLGSKVRDSEDGCALRKSRSGLSFNFLLSVVHEPQMSFANHILFSCFFCLP